MIKKIMLSFSVLFILSCDNSVNSSESMTENESRLYVALQGMGNKVAILDAESLDLIEMINIDFSNNKKLKEDFNKKISIEKKVKKNLLFI